MFEDKINNCLNYNKLDLHQSDQVQSQLVIMHQSIKSNEHNVYRNILNVTMNVTYRDKFIY